MTVHGAKGLEFPIVICSGATTAAVTPSRGVQVLFPPDGGYEVKLSKGVQTAHFELHQPVDEQMDFHEKLRLLYVACTRARDHLVVSVHRKARDLAPDEPHALDARRAAVERRAGARVRHARRTGALSTVAVASGGAARARPRPRRMGGRTRGSRSPRCTAGVRRRDHARASLAVRGDAGRSRAIPGSRRTAATSSCRRGTRAATAPRSDGRCTRCCRRSTSRPARASTTRRPRRRRPKVCSVTRRRSPRWPGSAIASACVQRASARPRWREMYVAVPLEELIARGLRRPRVPRRRRARRRRLQDRRGRRRGRARRATRALPGPDRRVRARDRRRRRASPSSGACCASWIRTRRARS